MLTPVADPAATGSCDSRRRPGRSFLEKPRPEEIDTDLINAGLYVLEPEVLELIPPGRPVSIEREVFPRSPRRARFSGSPSGLLARRGDTRVVPAGASRRARANLRDGGRRRARPRLHARRRAAEVHRTRARAARVRRAGRGGRERVRAWGASPSSEPAHGSREGGVVENAVVGADARSARGATRRRVDRRRRRQLGAGCELAQPLGRRARARRSGAGNVLDHGLRVGAGSTSRTRRSASRERATRRRRAGSRSRGAGSSSGPRRRITSASCSSSAPVESLSLQYHEREGRVVARAGGSREARARRGRRRRSRRSRSPRRHVPLPAAHGAPRHGGRGHPRHRGLDKPPHRRRAAGGPVRPGGDAAPYAALRGAPRRRRRRARRPHLDRRRDLGEHDDADRRWRSPAAARPSARRSRGASRAIASWSET